MTAWLDKHGKRKKRIELSEERGKNRRREGGEEEGRRKGKKEGIERTKLTKWLSVVVHACNPSTQEAGGSL